jgi:ATP-dependent Clp protease ATP-binding subunit ClpX
MAQVSKFCSFCGKLGENVEKLITGPRRLSICNECVKKSKQLLSENQGSVQKLNQNKQVDEKTPKEIKAYLDEHIIGQEDAKKALSVAVYQHYKRIKSQSQLKSVDLVELAKSKKQKKDPPQTLEDVTLQKGNILMVGPTGVGKTALAECVAKLLDVPIVIKDATTLTEAGYVGEDVQSIIKALWEASGKDVEKTQRGIVVLDEVDKIAKRSGSSNGRDVGGEGVQQGLLKLIESSLVNVSDQNQRRMSQKEMIQIDTTNILFIMCGAFVGIEKLIQARKSPGSIGFGNSTPTKKPSDQYNDLIKDLSTQDLTRFGLIPEFIGRLPVLVHLENLSEDDLMAILWKPKNSIVKQYQTLVEMDGVTLDFTEDAKRAIVQKAIKRKSGARGLRSLIEEVMLEVMYDIPDRKDIKKCVITADVVNGLGQPILKQDE